MAVGWVPSLMRDLTGGATTVTVPGETVRQVIEHLEAAYPGMWDRLCQGDRLNPSISVAVDGKVSRVGMLTAVGEASEVHFLPSVGGGTPGDPAPPPPARGVGRFRSPAQGGPGERVGAR